MGLVILEWYSFFAHIILCLLFVFWFCSLVAYRRRRDDHRCNLVHVTDPKKIPVIKKAQRFLANGHAVFALRESVYNRCESKLELFLVTLLFPPERLGGAVDVPRALRHLFILPFPLGPYSSHKCLFGNYYAHYRDIPFNLNGINLHTSAQQIHAQLYGTDILIDLLGVAALFVWIHGFL
jgi:hypothetical protein